jgi:hypothetical protein
MKFYFDAVVERLVQDNISVVVETDGGFKDALKKVREALKQYPKPVTEEGVKAIYTENRDQLESHLIHLERKVPTDDDSAA